MKFNYEGEANRVIHKFKELYNFYKDEIDQERKNMIVDEFINLCKDNQIWFNQKGKDIEYIFDYFLPIVRERVIEVTNKELNTVVQHLKNGDIEQANELSRKIAFHIPESYKDGFWFHAVITVIRTVILALAEDVAEAKEEKIDMLTVANVLENKRFSLDEFINSRADYSLAKNAYKGIFLMEFETRNRVIGEALISIKLRLQEVE